MSTEMASADRTQAKAARREASRCRRDSPDNFSSIDAELESSHDTSPQDLLHPSTADAADTIETLRAEMAAMQATMASMQGQLDTLQPSKQITSDEDAGYEKTTSLFAYCMDMIVKPDLSVLEFIRITVLLLMLTAAQYMLIFAFFDAVWWDAEVGRTFPAFKEAVELHNFYTGKTVDVNGQSQPIINVASSFFAIVLLTTGPVREDALQTLLAAQPMDRLFYRKNGSQVRWWAWIGNVLCVVPLQIAWGLRMMFNPTLAVLGTSMVMGSCESAIDIVHARP